LVFLLNFVGGHRYFPNDTSVAAIAAALGEDERAVWLALHQLTKAQLLTEAIAFPPDMSAAKSHLIHPTHIRWPTPTLRHSPLAY